MDRVLRGVSATLTQTVTVDGVPTDPSPDTATVTVTRADGTPVVTNQNAVEAGTGKFTYTLTSAQTALVDCLTIAWTFTLAGQSQTVTETVEVVGGFHFGLAQLRALDPLSDTVKYPTDNLEAARVLAEDALEDACGQAFVPRYTTLTTRVGNGLLRLPPNVTAIRSVTLDGTAWGASDLELTSVADGYVYGPARGGWWANGTYRVGVEHGHTTCPPWVSRASMLLARHFLTNASGGSGFTTVSSPDGTFSAAVPVVDGASAIFQVEEANRVVEQYRLLTV